MQNDESQPRLTAERNLLVFWEESRQSGHATEKAGRIMFDTVLMMRVTVPGDAKNTMEYWVQFTYPEGYPHPMFGKTRKNEDARKLYGKYIDEHIARQGGPQVVSGTPIEQWPMINRAQVANLKHNGVYSVEALSTLTDTGISALGMDGRKLVQQAKDWLERAKNDQAAAEAQAQRDRTEARFSALEEKYNELSDALAELPPDAQARVKDTIGKRRSPKAQAA